VGEPAQASPPPEPAALSALKEQFDVLRQRHELQERELQFLRMAAQQAQQPPPPPQVDPVHESLQAITVPEEAWNEVLAGGPRAAAIVTQALQHTYLRAVQTAEQRLMAAYQADQSQRFEQQQTAATAEQMRATFWEANTDLEQFTPIVQHFAREVAAEQPQRQFNWTQAQTEVARRARTYLQGIGVALPAQPAPRVGTAQAGRIQPPMGEMGGGRGVRGGSRTSFEQQFGDLLAS